MVELDKNPAAVVRAGNARVSGAPLTWTDIQTAKKARLGICFEVRLIQERRGYSVYVARLPGVVSQGENAEAALKNIQEAFLLAIETYQAEGMPIPWQSEAEPLQPGEKEFRIGVDV